MIVIPEIRCISSLFLIPIHSNTCTLHITKYSHLLFVLLICMKDIVKYVFKDVFFFRKTKKRCKYGMFNKK